MPSYALLAASCPAILQPTTYIDPTDGSPTVAPTFAVGESAGVALKHRQLSAKVDALGRGGAGGYAVAFGLELTSGGGLVLNISAGEARLDGPVVRDTAFTLTLSNNNGRHYVWIGQNGTAQSVFNSTTPPAGVQLFLGSVVVAASAISDIDYSGRFHKLLSELWVRYADSAAPGITPAATLSFMARTAGGVYHWDGVGWMGYSPLGTSSSLINVKDYGATGNGTTDDGPAIQAAITAAPDGATIYFPRGIYRVATGSWTHPVDGAKVGIHNAGKRLSFRGDGGGSILRAGAAGVDVLTYAGTDTPDYLRAQISEIRDLKFDNPAVHANCTALTLDRGYRNTVRNIAISGPSEGPAATILFTTGIRVRNSWIVGIRDCWIFDCTTGIKATEKYGTTGWDGPSNALTIYGGEIKDNTIGIDLIDIQRPHISGVGIEGNSTAGVRIDGGYQIGIDGCYFESNGWDVDLYQTTNPWRAARIDNALKVRARNGYGLTLTQPWDIVTHARYDIDETVFDVLMINPWFQTSDTNTGSRLDILNATERGSMRIVSAGETGTYVKPGDDVGENLLQNAAMYDGAAGWTLDNMAAETAAGAGHNPPGITNFVKTTTTVAATVCACSRAMNLAWDNALYRSRFVTVSMWIKIPDSTWQAGFHLQDNDRSVIKSIPTVYFDNTWRRVSTTIRIGAAAATSLSLRPRLVVGNAGGVGYVAAPTMSFGTIPLRPHIAEHLQVPLQIPRPVAVKAAQNLDATSQVDPFAAGLQYIQGNGGPITMGTAQALFSNSSLWKAGMRVALVGAHATNTITLQEGGSTNINLGAASRLIGQNTMIVFWLPDAAGPWIEVGYTNTAQSGINSDITQLLGLGLGSGQANIRAVAGNTINWGRIQVACGGGGTITLTSGQMNQRHIELTGAPAAGFTIVVPANSAAEWLFENQTGQAALVKTSGGTGITIAAARAALLRCNGVNVYRMTADVDYTV